MAGESTPEGLADSVSQSCVAFGMLTVVAIFATQLGQIYVESSDAGLGADGLPKAALVLAGFFSVFLLVQNLPAACRRLGADWSDMDHAPVLRVAALSVLAFTYVWTINLFQYALPTFFAMAGLLYLFGTRGVARLGVIAAVSVVAYYLLFFVLLGVFENPGKILSYDSYTFAWRIRQMIGLQ